jgi:hypothetical protein
MTENEITNESNPEKQKRKYVRRQPATTIQQQIAPSPHVLELEAGLVPLVNERLIANQKVRMAQQKANLANQELLAAQGELQQIESEVSYRMNMIGQLRNGGMPVPSGPYIAQNYQQPQQAYQMPQSSPPYAPVIPYPTDFPSGVGSVPAQNRGLYPDATDRLESAEDVRLSEMTRRG